MHMFGSHGFCRKFTAAYAGGARSEYLDSSLMSRVRHHVHEATEAERNECPAGHQARVSVATALEEGKQHRIHPDSPVSAVSFTVGYAVEPHRDAAATGAGGIHVPETITLTRTDLGIRWHFLGACTLFELPEELWQTVRVYILYPGYTSHATLPVVDGSGRDVEHGNLGSALVNRCVSLRRSPDHSLFPICSTHSPCSVAVPMR